MVAIQDGERSSFAEPNHKTAKDLLQKPERDFARLQQNPTDAGAAFDFFVTAYHMIEWAYPGDANRSKRQDLEKNTVLLQIASHLANGSKHFEATAKKHKSVSKTATRPGSFQAGAFQADTFDVPELQVRLQGDAAAQFGSSVKASALAEQLLQLWQKLVP